MEVLLSDEPRVRRDLLSVYGLYLSLLGRRPDRIGLANAAAFLASGATVAELETSIRGSDEYRMRRLQPSRDAEPAAPTVLDALDVIFDGHVPVANRSAYAWWRDEMNLRRHDAGGGPRAATSGVTFMLPIGRELGAEAVRSVEAIRAQRDDRWRLLLLADRDHAPDALRRFGPDRRIRLVRRALPLLARARAWALFRRCETALICLLHPGDLVADVAVGSLLGVSDADMVTSDGDRLGSDGRSHSPELVGNWDPDACLVREPPGLVAIRGAILRRIWEPGWTEVGPHHAWECCLGAAALARPGAIRHVRSVLLHRAPREKAVVPRTECLQRFLGAVHGVPTARVETDGGALRAVFPLPGTEPLASVIVPSRDQPALLRNCVEGVLERTAYANAEVVVVDNGSVTEAARSCLADLDADSRTTVLRLDVPFNWGALNAAGVDASRGDVLVFLNDDIDVVEARWLDELVAQALRPDVGLVGAKLLYPSGGIQHAGIVLDDLDAFHLWRHAPGDYAGPHGELARRRTVGAVTGACVAMRRSIYEEIGGFERENLAVTWGDIDLCLRVRERGYRVLWTPFALLHHVEQATRGPDLSAEKQARISGERAFMHGKWGSKIVDDPFFSPHLDPRTAVPMLRTRPKRPAGPL